MTFMDRCKAFYQQQTRNAIMRQGDPVEDLAAFVMAETGRIQELEDALPLVLYFMNDTDRDEFVALVREAKPNMITKKLP